MATLGDEAALVSALSALLSLVSSIWLGVQNNRLNKSNFELQMLQTRREALEQSLLRLGKDRERQKEVGRALPSLFQFLDQLNLIEQRVRNLLDVSDIADIIGNGDIASKIAFWAKRQFIEENHLDDLALTLQTFLPSVTIASNLINTIMSYMNKLALSAVKLAEDDILPEELAHQWNDLAKELLKILAKIREDLEEAEERAFKRDVDPQD